VFVDISFPDVTKSPDFIVFQNYYSSSVSIAQQVAVDEFVTILDSYQLMSDAHSESEAQNWHEIDCKLFNGNYSPGATMRFTMYQPDPSWLKYEIQNIKVISRSQSGGKGRAATAAFAGGLAASITGDWTLLLQAENAQKRIQRPPAITFSLAEYRKMQKKKEKKKDKKGAAGQLAVTNDEFGISIPDFSKNEDAL
jgi:hypothetical protein